MRSSRYLPFFTLGLVVLIWGFLWVPGKIGVTNSGVFVWAALRTFPAYVLLLVLLLLLRRPLRPRGLGLTALVGILQVGGFVGLTSAALVTSGAAHTVLLANTWQIWILVMAWVFLQERLRGLQWPAVGAGVVGLVFIIEPWRIHGVVSSLLAVAGALCFGGGAVAAKVLRRHHPRVDLLAFTTWQGFIGSLPLVVLAVLFPGGSIHWSAAYIWSLAYAILIGTALGAFLWLYVLSKVTANVAGIGNLATPIVGVTAASLALGEQLSAAEIAGMAFIVLALGLLATAGLKKSRSAGPAREPTAAEVDRTGPVGDQSAAEAHRVLTETAADGSDGL